MKLPLFASCLTLAVLPMCKPDSAPTNATAPDAAATVAPPSSPAEARTQFTALRDTADARWTRMLQSDDQKLADLRALLDNLSQLPALDQARVAGLRQAAAGLARQRYDRQTMAESARIDRYDAVQDSVLHLALPLAAPDGNAPTEAVRDYVEHIQAADASVINYRVQYDRAAKAYNAYLQANRETLAKAGSEYANLPPLPLFELSH